MINIYFASAAAENSEPTGIAALGVNLNAFVIQLISFLLVFLLLKKYAFGPIVKLLEERRKVIEDGVKMGMRMEKEKAKLDQDVTQILRDARTEADKIINNGQKEARDIIRDAEKVGQRKVEAMISDADARIDEETKQAKRKLEKEIVEMVSDATEAIVEEKVDSKKDAEIIEKALKDQR